MVRYYGWYSNRARGERAKHETAAGAPDTAEVEVIALIDDDEVIGEIPRHLKLWPEQGAPSCLSRAPPPDGGERIIEPCFDDLFPDYDTEPVMAYANDPDFAA